MMNSRIIILTAILIFSFDLNAIEDQSLNAYDMGLAANLTLLYSPLNSFTDCSTKEFTINEITFDHITMIECLDTAYILKRVSEQSIIYQKEFVELLENDKSFKEISNLSKPVALFSYSTGTSIEYLSLSKYRGEPLYEFTKKHWLNSNDRGEQLESVYKKLGSSLAQLHKAGMTNPNFDFNSLVTTTGHGDLHAYNVTVDNSYDVFFIDLDKFTTRKVIHDITSVLMPIFTDITLQHNIGSKNYSIRIFKFKKMLAGFIDNYCENLFKEYSSSCHIPLTTYLLDYFKVNFFEYRADRFEYITEQEFYDLLNALDKTW